MNTNRRQSNPIRIGSISRGLISTAILLAVVSLSSAQEPVPVVKPNYSQAERYSSRYLRQFVYDSSVRPNWIGKTDKFWYSYRTSTGTKYYRVDPKHAAKEDLFDHAKLASLLSVQLRKPLDSARMPLTRVEIEDDGSAIKFVVDKLQYQYNLETEELEKLGKAPPAPVTNRFGRRGQQIVEDEKKEEEEKKEEKKDVKKEQDKKTEGKGTKEKSVKKENNKKENSKDVQDDKKKTNAKTNRKRRSSSQEKKETVKDDDKNGDEEVKQDEKTTGEKRKQKTDEKTVKKTDDTTSKTDDKDEKEKKPQTDHRAFSPDRTAYVYAKGHDLYFVEIPEGYKYEAPESEKSKDADKSEADSKDKSDAKKGDAQKVTDKKKIADKKKTAKEKRIADKKKRANKKKVADEDESDKDKEKKKQEKEDDGDKTDDKKGDKDDDEKKVKTDKTKKTDDKAKVSEEDEDEEEKELPIPDIGPELDDTAIRLSEDGEAKFSFAGRDRARGRGTRSTTQTEEEIEKAKTKKTKPSVTWSKDSYAFYVSRRDSRKVKELFVINSLSNPRPTLEKYSYSMPGEEDVSISHFYYMTKEGKKLVELEKKWKNESFRNAHWKREGHQLRFVRSDRLLRNVEFCEYDLDTGKSTCLIEDGFEAANISMQSARYLKDTDEMIWFSERSGWAHFYLYDLDGNFKNAITSGEFRASRIVDIDEKNRLVYFTGNAREEGENVYQNHLYCVRLDGTGLALLDPGDANHRSTLSPSKKYLVDNCSRVDMAPVSVLRDAQGKEIMKLEESDMSRLKEVGWKMPSTFVVKAADGVTNLYGNIWKPFDFNPNKKYPVIAHVYPGPQMEGTSHTFSATAGNQQLAQLGFVVIQVGHRGGTPQRSKAYHSFGYFNLRDYGLADKKAAIEQLGQRFPWVDVERVGIYGHSGGGFMTAAALLREPYNDFFKVGVSTAGNHDNNIYNSSWSERYHGLKEVPVTDKETGSKSSANSSRQSGQTRTRRSGAPDMVGDYSAFSSEESDFFYEHEGFLNEDGELEFSGNHDLFDGPEAFRQQDTDLKTKQDKEKTEQDKEKTGDKTKRSRKKKTGNKTDTQVVDKTKGDEEEVTKSDGDKKVKSDSEKDEKKKTRFEIEVPTNAELAANLKGHLFLIHGESDNNVHPANTLRLVDALIKADKRFDMLYLPATRHGFGSYQPYVTQRMYEYFAEHLLNDYQSAADMEDRE